MRCRRRQSDVDVGMCMRQNVHSRGGRAVLGQAGQLGKGMRVACVWLHMNVASSTGCFGLEVHVVLLVAVVALPTVLFR